MKTERFQEENISDSFSNDEEIKINKSQLNQNLFNTERAIWDIKSKIFLISAWKIIKNKIEDDYNIENKLQNSIKITKEMEYYARIYEIEHLLKSNTVFDAIQTPCEFGRISVFEIFLTKNFM